MNDNLSEKLQRKEPNSVRPQDGESLICLSSQKGSAGEGCGLTPALTDEVFALSTSWERSIVNRGTSINKSKQL